MDKPRYVMGWWRRRPYVIKHWLFTCCTGHPEDFCEICYRRAVRRVGRHWKDT